jgi:hypothetical protein
MIITEKLRKVIDGIDDKDHAYAIYNSIDTTCKLFWGAGISTINLVMDVPDNWFEFKSNNEIPLFDCFVFNDEIEK